MNPRYPSALVGAGAIAVAAGTVGDWPAADPVVGGLEVPIAALLASLAVLAFLIAWLRWSGTVGPRVFAPVIFCLAIATVLLGSHGYAGVIAGDFDGVAAELRALATPLAVVAGGTLGVVGGLSDWFGISQPNARRRTRASLLMAGIGLAGLVAMFIWAQLLIIILLGFTGEAPSLMAALILSNIALGLGMGSVAFLYLLLANRSFGYIDLRWPTLADVAWTVVGVGALIVALVAVTSLLHLLGTPPAEHGLVEDLRAEGDPDLVLYVLIPSSILLIGPGEELLFRNIIQKSLYDHFSRGGAVIVASLIFSLAHIPAYWAGAETITAIIVLTVLSLILGAIYARTENIVVPAVIHGLYNAILFGSLYYDMTANGETVATLVGLA